jgi:uncharacterized protein YkwD
MKKLVLFSMLALSLVTHSQTDLDFKVLKLVNEYRVENHLCPFTWDTMMFKVAVNQSNYMSATGHLYHDQIMSDSLKFKVTPDFTTKFIKQGVNFKCYASENCSVVFNADTLSIDCIAKRVVEGWKKSPPHNEMLLDTVLTHVGVSHLIGYKYEEFSYNELGDEFVEIIECEMVWVSLDGYGIR